MKKLLVLVMAGIMVIIVITGCFENETKETTKNNVERFITEETIIEHTEVEETITERRYIDGEYEAESDYNSKVNTWGRNKNVTYWD